MCVIYMYDNYVCADTTYVHVCIYMYVCELVMGLCTLVMVH